MSFEGTKRLLISTDHKWRDLPGNVYLSLLLKKFFGIDAKVIPVWTEGEWAQNFRPHAITVPSLVPGLVRRA